MSEPMQVKSVRMPEVIWARMDSLAGRLGLSRSDVHRRMLEYALDAFEEEVRSVPPGPLGRVGCLARLQSKDSE